MDHRSERGVDIEIALISLIAHSRTADRIALSVAEARL